MKQHFKKIFKEVIYQDIKRYDNNVADNTLLIPKCIELITIGKSKQLFKEICSYAYRPFIFSRPVSAKRTLKRNFMLVFMCLHSCKNRYQFWSQFSKTDYFKQHLSDILDILNDNSINTIKAANVQDAVSVYLILRTFSKYIKKHLAQYKQHIYDDNANSILQLFLAIHLNTPAINFAGAKIHHILEMPNFIIKFYELIDQLKEPLLYYICFHRPNQIGKFLSLYNVPKFSLKELDTAEQWRNILLDSIHYKTQVWFRIKYSVENKIPIPDEWLIQLYRNCSGFRNIDKLHKRFIIQDKQLAKEAEQIYIKAKAVYSLKQLKGGS